MKINVHIMTSVYFPYYVILLHICMILNLQKNKTVVLSHHAFCFIMQRIQGVFDK